MNNQSSDQRHRPEWICAQIGAREHYAVARALHQESRLARFCTDYWAGPLIRKWSGSSSGLASKSVKSTKMRSATRPLRTLATRFHPELAGTPVNSWNWRSLMWEAKLRKTSGAARYLGFVEVGSRFGTCVRDSLKNRRNLGENSIFFAYDTGALEAMEWCKERGSKIVLDQMDPNRIEVDQVHEEEKRWPDWQTAPSEVPEEFFRRREKEWKLADRIVVNSEFCLKALLQQGVEAEKLVVVPLCYETDDSPHTTQKPTAFEMSAAPLRVLWLGQVILRKGIQYLMEAARKLEGSNIRFDVIGPIGISPAAIHSAPCNVVFHGRANRDEAAQWYKDCDVFVLPTLSDGFAITQLEAMAHGLPVVATPCCGSVVSDGMDGFIVPPRDSEALAKSLQRYADEPALLKYHRSNALEKSKKFTLNHLAANLLRLESMLIGNK